MSELKLLREFSFFTPKPDLLNEIDMKTVEKTGRLIIAGKISAFDEMNQNGRKYPEDILRREIENYNEIFVKNNRALGECVPPGTEIFTSDRGWINIEDISVGDSIYTINLENNHLEIQKVRAKIDKEYEGEMLHIHNNSSIDMMVTPDHKIVWWDRYGNPHKEYAKNVKEKWENKDSSLSHGFIKKTAVPKPTTYKETVKFAGKFWDSKAFAAFMGIYIAEGWCKGIKSGDTSRRKVSITQKKESTKELIKKMLEDTPYDWRENKNGFSVSDKDLYEELYELGDSYHKHIPEKVKELHPELLGVFTKWALIGDGRNRKNRKGELIRELCTTSPRLADDMFEIFLRMGSGASINYRTPKDRSIEGRNILSENSQKLNLIQETNSNSYLDSRFLNINTIPYNGRVYCVNVPNGTWLMRYNNKICWTSNCDHPDDPVVKFENVSHRIVGLWWEGNQLMAKIEILKKFPKGKILEAAIQSDPPVPIGFSSRGIGSTKQHNGETVVNEDFQLICFDAVTDPSSINAFANTVLSENHIKRFDKIHKINYTINSILKTRLS